MKLKRKLPGRILSLSHPQNTLLSYSNINVLKSQALLVILSQIKIKNTFFYNRVLNLIITYIYNVCINERKKMEENIQMNVWERIKGFIKKIKENKKDQLTLNEKNEIREIVENTNQNNTPDLNQEKQQFVKNVNEDEITTTYVVNINGWVENRLQREIRNICINTVLPTFKGELIEKHRKRVEELLVNAISEQADADKYV